MAKIRNWTRIKGRDAWRNDESGIVVEVADLRDYGANGYGFGFFDPNVNKIRGIDGGYASDNRNTTYKKAVQWLKAHPYIEKRW